MINKWSGVESEEEEKKERRGRVGAKMDGWMRGRRQAKVADN
jgi:hypothetical protein